CQELPTTELATSQDYALLQLENAIRGADRILKRTDAETGEIYAVLIPYHLPTIQTTIQYAHNSYSAETFPRGRYHYS
ncbi:MAG: hypothetical protein WBB01_12555, partial [Phormidesmis sp.]